MRINQTTKIMSVLSLIAISANAYASPVTTPYIDPTTLNSLNQQGAKVVINGDNITITGPNINVNGGGTIPTIPSTSDGCGSCTTSVSSFHVLGTEIAINSPTVSTSPIDPQIQSQTKNSVPTLTQTGLTAYDFANLSPSARGNQGNDIYASANSFLKENGLGGY